MNITRSRIKNIGKKLKNLKEGQKLELKEFEDLTWWRDSHSASLNYLVKMLEKDLLESKVTQYSISQRLKRIYSIKLKLGRFENMQLSMMDDIAGTRVVLECLSDVENLYNQLKGKDLKYKLLKVNNYISRPKEDGYRGIHLVYRTNKKPAVQIELQLRTNLQHVWATAVEVFGTIIKTSFKTGDGEQRWRNFFRLLSSSFAQKEGTSILAEHEVLSQENLNQVLVKLIKELNIIEKLNAYTSVYRSDWMSSRSKGRMGKYALLILDNISNTTKVEFFSEKNRLIGLKKYSEVENNYLDSEKINAVFISVDDMNKLSKAYPNYFMDTKELIQYLSLIVLGKF